MTRLASALVILLAGGAPGPRGVGVVTNMTDNTATISDATSGTVLATLPEGSRCRQTAGGRS